MPSYCTAANVSTLLPFDIGVSTRPTTAETESLIEEFEGEINVALQGRGVSTPMTDTDFVGLIRKHVRQMTAVSAYRAAYGITETPEYLKQWEDAYYRFVRAIKEETINIPTEGTGGSKDDPAFRIVQLPFRDNWHSNISEDYDD